MDITLLQWSLLIVSVLFGCYSIWISLRGSHETIRPVSPETRHFFKFVGIYENTLARRIYWGVVGVLLFGVAYFFYLLFFRFG
jgi:hypothetical protein